MKQLLFLTTILIGLNFSESNACNYCGHTHLDYYPTIEGEENGRLNVTEILEKQTIKANVANNSSIKVQSFEIELYNGGNLVNTHKFEGGIAPNIFKKYRYDKENEDVEGGLKLVTRFILKLSIYDEGRVVALAPRLIYIYVEPA
ncbi:MAG: hypothetical protein JXB49_27480 [Bacteroidales bacterium]|nr:hypothetical protein [Bacteroidales bacterium]